MRINVDCVISDENKESFELEDIIEKVKTMHKEEITYRSPDFKALKDSDCRELDCIDTTIRAKGNVYFIFDDKKLLYVGKSLDIKQRLRQHLIKCSKKTYSKIQDVQKYLKDNRILSLSYCAIEVSVEKFYGTVEGMIIKYIHQHESDFLYNWNLRED